jgi:hypothetical protein
LQERVSGPRLKVDGLSEFLPVAQQPGGGELSLPMVLEERTVRLVFGAREPAI